MNGGLLSGAKAKPRGRAPGKRGEPLLAPLCGMVPRALVASVKQDLLRTGWADDTTGA